LQKSPSSDHPTLFFKELEGNCTTELIRLGGSFKDSGASKNDFGLLTS
jgi:hypothetical protein